MRVLFALVALCAISVYAAPQYGYQPASSNSGFGLRPGNGILSSINGGGGGAAPANGEGNALSHGAGRGGDKYLPPESEQAAPLINKQFYTISAPEDNATKSKHLVLGQPQKNYRVIFIKAPADDNVKYSAEFAPQEEKTVIYVLHKKGEDIDSTNVGTPAPTVPSKPEVFFIKYKTPEEAQQAQKEIQEQYDQLGGSNQFGEETAHVSSVIGALESLNPDGSYNYRQLNSGSSNLAEPQQAQHPQHVQHAQQPQQAQQPSPQYLPSFLKA